MSGTCHLSGVTDTESVLGWKSHNCFLREMNLTAQKIKAIYLNEVTLLPDWIDERRDGTDYMVGKRRRTEGRRDLWYVTVILYDYNYG